MPKRAIVGGIVVVGIAIGAMLSNYFSGWGTGGGGEGTRATIAPDASEERAQPSPPQDAEVPETEPSRSAADPPAVLEIVVGEKSYAIRRRDAQGEVTRRPVGRQEAVEMARQAPGDESGIRVRVFRRESSRPTAEIALEEALTEAGLSEESIYWEDELLK